MSSSSPNWLDLPPELWAAISGKHLNSIPDYFSFRAVCRSWRSIATFHNFDTAIPRIPWLMCVSNEEEEGKRITKFANLFDLSTNKAHKTINFYPADGRRYPSSQGWILCVSDVNREVYLTHPMSRVKIELPSSDTFPEDLFVVKMVLSTCNPAAARKERKIDDDDLVVMVIWSFGEYSDCNERLGFARPGDSSWTVMDGKFADILYHNGKLYAVDDSNETITVVEFDIHARPNPTQPRQVFSLPYSADGENALEAARAAATAAPDFVDDGVCIVIRDPLAEVSFDKKYYLLESCGKFIIVIRHAQFGTTFWFEIFEFDLKDGSHREINKQDWNKTLFLGFDSSVCVDLISDVVKPNCIYFTDDNYSECLPFDMGVFCLLTGKTTWGFLEGFSDYRRFFIPPTWVMPTF